MQCRKLDNDAAEGESGSEGEWEDEPEVNPLGYDGTFADADDYHLMASDMIDLGLGVDLFAEEEEDPEILADPLNQLDLKVSKARRVPLPWDTPSRRRSGLLDEASVWMFWQLARCEILSRARYHLLGQFSHASTAAPDYAQAHLTEFFATAAQQGDAIQQLSAILTPVEQQVLQSVFEG